jgi:hypothetical protein
MFCFSNSPLTFYFYQNILYLATSRYSLWFDPTGLDPTIYRNQDEHANLYATDTVPICDKPKKKNPQV